MLPNRIGNWSLTSSQQRRVKTGGRLVKHARYQRLLLAESHLTRRLFGAIVRWIAALPVATGSREAVGAAEMKRPGVTVGELSMERNLGWHLNHCNEPDPLMNGALFCENTPFISAARSDNMSRG